MYRPVPQPPAGPVDDLPTQNCNFQHSDRHLSPLISPLRAAIGLPLLSVVVLTMVLETDYYLTHVSTFNSSASDSCPRLTHSKLQFSAFRPSPFTINLTSESCHRSTFAVRGRPNYGLGNRLLLDPCIDL